MEENEYGPMLTIIGIFLAGFGVFIAMKQFDFDKNSYSEERQERVEEKYEKQQDRGMDWQRHNDKLADSKHSHSIVLKNNCSEEIDVAIHFRGLDNNWVTKGWYTIKPYSTTRTNIKTKNKIVYFHADGYSGSHRFDVVSSRFTHISGYSIQGRNKRKEKFFKTTFSSRNDYIQKFSCN